MQDTTTSPKTVESLPTNGRELSQARRALCLSRGEFAAVAGVPYLSLTLQELGVLPLDSTLASLTGAFAAGFRPDNWPH